MTFGSCLPAAPNLNGLQQILRVIAIGSEFGAPFARNFRAGAFARELAEVIVDRDSSHYTLEAHKEKRKGRILIDVNRNGYAQTAAAAYSVRARDGAPVSVPFEWSELRKRTFRPNMYTIRNVFARLEKVEDPWKDMGKHHASLKSATRRLHSFHAA